MSCAVLRETSQVELLALSSPLRQAEVKCPEFYSKLKVKFAEPPHVFRRRGKLALAHRLLD